jgi:general stress protein YciG
MQPLFKDAIADRERGTDFDDRRDSCGRRVSGETHHGGSSGINPNVKAHRGLSVLRAMEGGAVMTTRERKQRRGFASMSPDKQREIARKGGRAAHQKGTAHEWTADEARSAGRKGGQVSRGGRGRLAGTVAEQIPPPMPDRGTR